MTSATPNTIAAHRDPGYSEDEDKVVFRSPSEKPNSGPNSAITPIGAKRTSLGVSPHQSTFSASANGKDSTGHSPDTATGVAQWSYPQQSYGDSDQSWGMDKLKLSDGQDGVLAPAAEINELGGQPHSRQSSAGGSSNYDSPALPTPGQGKVESDADKTFKGQPFSPVPVNAAQNGYPYGYDAGMGFMADQFASMMNGHVASPTQVGALHSAMSPLVGALPRGMVPPFSPHLAGSIPPLNLRTDTQQQFPTQDDFAGYITNGRMNGRAAGRGQQNGAAATPTAYPTLNGQPAPAANPPAGYPYGSPPTQPTNPYAAAGLMSPTITSPTFLPSGVYGSPIPAPNPYGVYGATQTATSMYDMMSPQSQLAAALSPPVGAGALPVRTQTQVRGHGYSASNPATLRDAAAAGLGQRQQGAGVAPTARLGGQQRQQPPRATQAPMMNHGHSLSVPHASPYSPQLGPQPYGPMSPPPYPAYFPGFTAPGLSQQQTDLLQAAAMVGMAAMAQQHPGVAGAAYNPSVQTALSGLQKDPAVMALIQAGGGPSANNRKLGLYKTELCRSWEEKGSCKYGEKCQFAHGDAEQRKVERHPKYKTEICRTFWVSGSCPYGKRCCFIHTELPASSGVPGQGEGQRTGTTPTAVATTNDRQQAVDGRARSMSTNSDPNDAPSSLLARISARAQANQGGTPTAAVNGAGHPNRSTDASPSQLAEAIARAYSAYGMPGGQSTITTHTPPAPPEPTPPPQPQTSTNGVFSGFSSRGAGTPNSGFGTGSGAAGGGHHRVSASVDFGRSGRGLGSDLTLGLGHGLGHQRNPSASSVVPSSSAFPQLSRTPLSGQSTPFGETSSVRGVAVGSSLLDHPW